MRATLLGFAACIASAAPLPAQEPSTPFGDMVRREIARADLSVPARPRGVDRTALGALYPGPDPRPLWTSDGRPTTQARAVVRALLDIGSHGLRPADYDADSLSAAAAALDTGPPPGEIARFDVALSVATMRALAELHAGRVDPRTLGFDVLDGRTPLDLVARATAMSRSDDPTSALFAVEPQRAEYAALLPVLRHYRALAADSSLRPPRASRRALRAGDAYADAPALRRLLAALGDLPANGAVLVEAADSLRYDSTLAEAVRAFQQRHALEPDGVVGPATMRQLRVPLARRVLQLELALERWRWLPDSTPERYVVVNSPAFELYAFDRSAGEPQPVLHMKVIVGQAQKRHGTPVFAGTMREVVFRPYWDVPPRIAREEIIPKLRKRPSAYASEGFEIVSGGEADATRYPFTEANLQRVVAGALRIRQRPGPDNPLGGVKLVFPNPYNVFLHGTPAAELFARTRRDFSHGCIRVEHPAALVRFALDDSVTWSPAAIDSAMTGEVTRHVRLPRPVAVYVLYLTAVVGRDDQVYFYPDLYGRDAALERALDGRGAPARSP